MMLFNRQLRVAGGPPAVAWATEVTALVNEHATSEVALWVGSFGTQPTMLGWSAALESLSQVDDLNATLMGTAQLMVLYGALFAAGIAAGLG